MNNFQNLSKLSLFEGFDKKELMSLVERDGITNKNVDSGETILFQGDPYTKLHILVDGSAFAEVIDVSGKSMRIEPFEAPDVLAPGVIFSRHDEMPGSVIADSDCSFLIFSRQAVLRLCGESAVFRENFIRLISDRFVFISNRMSFLSFTTIKGKVAQYLLTLPGNGDKTVDLPIKMEELAAYFGVTRPSVSRVFIELEGEGLIQKNNKHIRIVDPTGLKELLQ